CARGQRDLHSFPTRRSSDLGCKLSRIVLKNNQDDVINTYSLVYSNQGGASRLFLDELKTYGQDGIAYDSHKFDYKTASNLPARLDRKSTRLNSSHVKISYAV